MPSYKFRKGLHILFRNREYTIERRLPNGELQIQDIATNEFKPISEQTLIEALFSGSLILLGDKQRSSLIQCKSAPPLVQDLCLLNDTLRAEAKRRFSYVQEIELQGLNKLTADTLTPLIEEVSQTLRDYSPPSWITLYKWYRRFEAAGRDIRALVKAEKTRGNRQRKFSCGNADKAEATINIINELIAEKYLSPSRPTVGTIYDLINARIVSENEFRDEADKLSFPHRSSIYEIVKKLDPYEVTKARYGKLIADHKYGAVKQGPRPTRPLERVEIDHTKLDMLVVDPVMRLPVGRPWMTLAIDKYTRMVLGMYMSFNNVGYLSVMQCLLHAIRPKTYVKDQYPEIKNTWDAYGIPEALIVDNGMEFYSTHFEDACLQLGIRIDYAPPRSGQYKGTVERWFRTQNQQLLHGQPGTTFSNIIDRADYDPTKNAVISADALDEMAHIFIIDVYHQRVHQGVEAIPALLWKKAIEEFPPALPSSYTELEVLLGCIKRRAITASGIKLHALFYNDDGLACLRRTLKAGEKVMVKYDPTDISIIYVADKEQGRFIPVPALNQEYTKGLSLWQHELIRRYVRRNNKNAEDIVALCLAKQKIQEIVEREWWVTKRSSTRQRLARFINDWPKARITYKENRKDEGQLGLVEGEAAKSLAPIKPHQTWKGVSNVGNAIAPLSDVDNSRNANNDRHTKSIDENPSTAVNASLNESDDTNTRTPKKTTTDNKKAVETSNSQSNDETEFDISGWDSDYDLPK